MIVEDRRAWCPKCVWNSMWQAQLKCWKQPLNLNNSHPITVRFVFSRQPSRRRSTALCIYQFSSMKLCICGSERDRYTDRQRATEGDTEAGREVRPQRRLQAVGTMPARAHIASAHILAPRTKLHRHGPTKLERRRDWVTPPCAETVSTPVCHHLALSVPQK